MLYNGFEWFSIKFKFQFPHNIDYHYYATLILGNKETCRFISKKKENRYTPPPHTPPPMPASVAQLDARPTGGQEVSGSTSPDPQNSFVEIDHKIFSTVIISLPLIQEGQLSVSGERMCTIWLTA